jgi:flagellin
MSSINTNLASLYAQKNMSKLNSSMPTAVERLSSGLRINRAKDDAAGLGIAEKIQTQVKATTQSMKNANDAISMVQAAEGSLAEVSSMLQRMKELTIQGRNGSYNTSQRKTLTDEIFALRDEINLIAERTTFNGLSLLKSALNTSISIATGGGLQNADIALEGTSDQTATAGILVGSMVTLTNVRLSNANAGKYVMRASSTHITIEAIASATGLTGMSQTIAFEDFVTEEAANRDLFNAATGYTMAASSAVTLNFDRLGIKFELTNQNSVATLVTGFMNYGVTAGSITTAGSLQALAGVGSTIVVSAGTTQAEFQSGANTRDTFAVTGFKDIRIFDRNLNGDTSNGGVQDGLTGDQITAANADYRVFSRLNEILKDMSPQTEAVLTASNFTDLANRLEDVITTVTEIRSGLGAQNNRIEFAIGNIQAQTENMTAAMGRIRDTDFAAETANLTRLQILQQAATAMLSQANQMPNVVLSLLR